MFMLVTLRNATPPPSLARRAAGATIQAYKRYVSPYLGTHCRFDPSCSAYTYEAVAEHGVLKGSVMGLLRIARCNADSGGGPDPVPGYAQRSAGVVAPLQSFPAATPGPSSLAARAVGDAARIAGGVAGAVAGAALGGIAGWAAGIAVGACAGAHRLDALNERVERSMGEQAVVGAAILARPLGMAGHRVWQGVSRLGMPRAAALMGCIAGTCGGAVVGVLGGALRGGTAGGRVFGLMAMHFVLEKTGAETRPCDQKGPP